MEEAGNIASQRLRLFGCGEVGPARHFGPTLNVVSALDPATRRERIFLGEACDGAGYADLLARFELKRCFFRLVIQAARGMDRFGHPIKRHVAEQFVFGESAFHIAIAVRPVAKFLDNPGGQSRWRIVQTVGYGLRRVALQVSIGSKINVPAVRVVERTLLDVVECVCPARDAAGRIRECN